MLICSKDMFERFCYDEPIYRRWYVARITGGVVHGDNENTSSDERGNYIDLYYSTVNKERYDEAKKKLDQYSRSDFRDLNLDDMNWWSDEDFDNSVHLRLQEFIQFLNAHNSIHQDQSLEEGMVFIEAHHDDKFRFIHYTSQARNASKKVVQQLLHDDI